MTDVRGRRGRDWNVPGRYDASAAATQRLARIHRIQTAQHRDVVEPITSADRIHPACRAAANDGATPCRMCSWLLDLDNEGARYIEAHLDDGGAW